MTYAPGLWLFILASFLMSGVFLYSLRYRNTETGRAFLFLMACAAIWTIGFTLETAITTLQGKLFLDIIEFIGITYLPAAWVFLVLSYTGQAWLHKNRFLFLIIPSLTNLVLWTNPFHHWFMGSPRITNASAPFPVLVADYQFWFYFVHAPYAYLCILTAVIILVHSMTKMDEIYKIQASLLLVAILLPTISDVLYVLGYSPVRYYNYTTAVFSVSSFILLQALFRFGFLDLLPLARDTVIDNLDIGITVLDHKDRIIYLNPSARQLFHISPDIIGKPIDTLPSDFLQKIVLLKRENRTEMDVEVNEAPGRYFDLRLSPVCNRHGLQIGQVVTSHDITERVQLFNQVQALSIQDSLTGIFNRRHFIELCRHEIAHCLRTLEAFTVVMIDLDHFKNINDAYGHAVGDQVLIAFTRLTQSILRQYDIFGRLGGEEFALMLIGVTEAESYQIIERLRSTIEKNPALNQEDTIPFTASFGAVSSQRLSSNNLEIEKMLRLADQALYQAKQSGRNRVSLYEQDI